MTNLPVIGFNQQELQDIAGQLSPRSRRIYENDAKVFAQWIASRGLSPHDLTRSEAIAYRAYLQSHYAKSTAGRMLSVARRIMQEQIHNQTRQNNPFENVAGFTASNETTHTALNKTEARDLLGAVDASTKLGKRDYAIIALMLRTGIRRSECVALNVSDIREEQGHKTAVIEHGKGDKRRIVKIPVDVYRALEDYVQACQLDQDGPLFVRFHRGDTPSTDRLTDKAVEKIVIGYAAKIGIALTPHGLRASFVTLSLEGGAKLEQVQYAAGHADPRTTERYQRRKLNLDDNAVDYIKL